AIAQPPAPDLRAVPLPARWRSYSLPKVSTPIDNGPEAVVIAIRLFEQACRASADGQRGTIFLTWNGAESLVDLSGIHAQLQTALREALQHGWDLRHFIRLDRDPARSIAIVETILAYVGTSAPHEPYYLADHDALTVPYDLCLAPGIGGLLLFATGQAGHD